MLRAKVNGKYPYLIAVVKGNGRVKPGFAIVKGVETKGVSAFRFHAELRI